MLGLEDVSPTIQAIVTSVCGIGAIGYFLWQVFSRIKIDDRRAELDQEQKSDRESLRKRNAELESRLQEVQEKLLDTNTSAAGSSALNLVLKEQLNDFRRREVELCALLETYKKETFELRERIVELSSQSSGAGTALMQLQKRIIELTREHNELEQQLSEADELREESEELFSRAQFVLLQSKFFLDGCKGCQCPDMRTKLLREIPKYLPAEVPDNVNVIEQKPYKGTIGKDEDAF